MNITRSHNNTTRYEFDCGRCSLANGWAQLDTKQDASYYGTWANPTSREMLSYCEGDITHKQYDTDDEFIAAVREWAAWVNEYGYGPAAIDPGWSHDGPIAVRFIALGLDDLIH
jgi:hypothetical protein